MTNSFENISFGKIPHGWFNDNEFINQLTNAEKWILACISSFIYRSRKIDPKFPPSKKLTFLYSINGLLVSMISERTIADKCNFNRGTVCKAIDKFDEYGAVIKISGKKGKGYSNLYIMGFERREKVKKEKTIRTDFLFSNSPVLRSGQKIPDDIKEFIRDRYNKIDNYFPNLKMPGYDSNLGDLIFNLRESPLLQETDNMIDLEDFRQSKCG
jgi:hypothetical protein